MTESTRFNALLRTYSQNRAAITVTTNSGTKVTGTIETIGGGVVTLTRQAQTKVGGVQIHVRIDDISIIENETSA